MSVATYMRARVSCRGQPNVPGTAAFEPGAANARQGANADTAEAQRAYTATGGTAPRRDVG